MGVSNITCVVGPRRNWLRKPPGCSLRPVPVYHADSEDVWIIRRREGSSRSALTTRDLWDFHVFRDKVTDERFSFTCGTFRSRAYLHAQSLRSLPLDKV